MPEEPNSPPPIDTRSPRAILLSETIGQYLTMIETVSHGRTAVRFTRNTKPSSLDIYKRVYNAIDDLVGLTSRLLSQKLVENIERWLDSPNPMQNGAEKFMRDATTYSRLIKGELDAMGLINIQPKPINTFPMQLHEDLYGYLDDSDNSDDPPDTTSGERLSLVQDMAMDMEEMMMDDY
ncbi:MAG: hypothetical protein GWP10_21600 [Nitrospiraceae bacterium]|nr:hypothetical protein [Nitrospiraceae bacterium]